MANKKYLAGILLLIGSVTMGFAQTADVTGVYYLEGVMETASGFNFHPDSTFEFFFSQGALDRTGTGTWTRNTDTLVLNSNGKMSNGFVMVKSAKRPGNKIRIKINDPNKMMVSFVHARTLAKDTSDFTRPEENGIMEWTTKPFEKLELYFELVPERAFPFAPLHPGDNDFEFTIDPEILTVYFDRLSLQLIRNGLYGAHPLLTGGDFVYRKEN